MIDFKQITNKIVIESNINITKYTLYNVYDDLGILKLRLANSNHLAGNTYKATHISLNDCLIGENVILTSICKLSNSLLTGFPVVDNGDIYLGEDGLITNTQVTDSLDLYQVIGFQSNDYTEITIHDSKTNIDGVYNGYEIYENIASGTAGTITIPSSAEILLDKYPDAGDCLIVKTDTNGKPMDEPAKDSSENIIQGTLDISGNYTLSATPSSYPVSIVFQIKLSIKYFSVIEDRFVNRTELYRASEIEYDNTTSSLTSTQVQSAIDEVNNKIDSDRGVFYTGEAERTVGGITDGQTFTDATMTEMWDALIKQEKFPILTVPSNTFTASITGLREVGEVIDIDFNSGFNRGSISPQYTALSPFRSGLPNEYIYSGSGLSNETKTDLTDTQSISNYTVLINGQSWTGGVAYDEGVQPKSSYDNDFDSSLPAGSTSSVMRTITGVYPIFATTTNLVTLIKQSLQYHGSAITKTFIAEDGTNKQKLQVPDVYGTLTKLEQYNTLSGQWDTISTGSFTQTTTNIDVNGSSIAYKVYTHNSSTIGSRQLRFTF